jgi:acyl-CoA synthetase (AMP-forming)/AMP-acid ligase II
MMDDFPLSVQMLFRHGRGIHHEASISTWTGQGSTTASFAETADRVERLAAALARLGILEGDRVGTFMWNDQAHVEAYFAVPCMGAVLHTLNIRLFPEQLRYVVNHARDRAIIVDESLVPLLARVASELGTVEHFIVTGSGDGSSLGASSAEIHSYDALIGASGPGFAWPELSERAAAALCYTTGTTGDPKGVAYSHRSIVLHTLGASVSTAVPVSDADRALLVVPQFHAMAWGLPYVCWTMGADMVLPERFLQAAPLVELIETEQPTFAAAIPAIWNEVLHHTDTRPSDLSSLRYVVCGGAAVPRALIDAFRDRHGVPIVQAWGMTETSPAAAVARPPRGTPDTEASVWYAKSGRVLAGVELRIVDDAGSELPWDGHSVGEIEVRGPWITGRYYRDDAPEKFHDGWLRTGDVATVDTRGYVQITDRAKDIIKSGGEWISSVALENVLMAHPDVAEATVIGVPDDRWDERPLACIVRKAGADVSPGELLAFLGGKIAKWWLPERWCFIDEIPKTSVGKFDKKLLRSRYAEAALPVVNVDANG